MRGNSVCTTGAAALAVAIIPMPACHDDGSACGLLPGARRPSRRLALAAAIVALGWFGVAGTGFAQIATPQGTIGATGTDQSFGIGAASATAAGCFAIGAQPAFVAGTSNCTGTDSFVIGNAAGAAGAYSFGLGFGAFAGGVHSIAQGLYAFATADNALAIGTYARATDTYTTALGYNAQATASNAVAIGQSAFATGTQAIAVGTSALASGQNSMAQGAFALAAAPQATALGSGAQATAANSVALGSGSVADRSNTVSVGAPGATRQVANVSAGTAPTDAVNVQQLNTTAQQTQNAAQAYTDKRFASIYGAVDDVGHRADAGVASAMAVASLPQPYRPDQSMLGVALGGFNGQAGFALGVSRITGDGSWVLKANANVNTNGNVGVGVGAGFTW